MAIFGRVFGTKNDRELKRLWPRVHAINALEPDLKTRSDAELAARLRTIREHVQAAFQAAEQPGKPPLKREAANRLLDPHLNEVFALVREAGRRVLGMRHFDVQLLGGMVLHEGKIAEMKTGEGKTLVATLPAVLAALAGKGVHIVTVNDYLATRDSEWMGRVYRFLGLTVGTVLPGLDEAEKKRAYAADITHGQNNEFGFDYLRDNMKYALSDYVQREPFFAIVDEVDSILIDEARTPLIISGPMEKGTQEYETANALVPKLRQDEHYTIDEKARVVMLTEAGVTRCEEVLRLENLYDPANISILHHASQALRAHCLYKRDVDYIVERGQVVIVDEHTGRLMPGRRWSDGLHQAVEAKESVTIEEENQTLATVTFQNFFRMYTKLSGMTGTADTEAEEFAKIYDLDVIVVPTNRRIARVDEDDQVYKTEREKVAAVAADIKDSHDKGQPVLVGTVSVEKSEVLSTHLKRMEIPHNVLNAKHHRQEAGIIAQAGRLGAVTIATNMAGRGTDILLGGNPEFMARVAVAEKLGGTEDAARHLGFLEEQPDFINTQRLAERDAQDSRWLQRMAHRLQENPDLLAATVSDGQQQNVVDPRHPFAKPQDKPDERNTSSVIPAKAGIHNPTQREGVLRSAQDDKDPPELTLDQVRDYTIKQRKAFYDRAVQLYTEELQRCRAVCEQEKRQVIAAGGLRIIGTERHESRRIDNQLRGRSGRQGDPGSSCFYLSLQDDLMRIFGSDRMLGMMERLGMEDGVPIEHPWVSKSIAGAQKRVEGFHFDSRKQLLEYDDVMNQQRKAIYTLRRRVLGGCVPSRSPFCHPRESGDPGDQNTRGSSLSHIGAEPLSKQKEAQPPHNETIHKLIFDLVERAVVDLAQAAAPSNTPVSEWKLADLREEVRGLFGVSVQLDAFTGSRDDLMDTVYTRLEQAYSERAEQVGAEKLHELERVWYLQAIDHRWREHLQAMEHLREGIHFRGYAQKDPKQEYKREGFHLFQSMMAHIRSSVLEQAFTGEVPPDADERARHDLAAMQQAVAQAAAGGARHPAASGDGATGDSIDLQQLRALLANRSDSPASPAPNAQEEQGLNRHQRRLRKARARKEGGKRG